MKPFNNEKNKTAVLPVEEKNNIAVLIDADNTQSALIEKVFDEIEKEGNILVKRAYANWRKMTLSPWKEKMQKLGIKAIQQFDYVTKKNASDIAIVIDAMDLLYKGKCRTFVLVTSDSDFTPLAIRLKEEGVNVIGAGEEKTPLSFVKACSSFIFLNTSAEKEKNGEIKKPKDTNASFNKANRKKDTEVNDRKEEIRALLLSLYQSEEKKDDDGYILVSAAGTYIKEHIGPDFDSDKYYGKGKGLSFLIRKLEDFETKGRGGYLKYRIKKEEK